MYGTRKASQVWGELAADVFYENNYTRLVSNGALFGNKTLDVTCAVHGDDFISEGDPEHLDEHERVLEANFITRIPTRLGPGGAREAAS